MEIIKPSSPPPWHILGTSVTGTRHQKRDQPCQDAHCWQLLANGILLMTVADGAGSASLAEVGAQLSVQTVIDTLSQTPSFPDLEDVENWEKLLKQTLMKARHVVEKEASVRDIPVRHLACTLMVAVATPQWVTVIQVGDGAIVIADRQGVIQGLTIPPTGEYINETVFLISDGAIEQAQFQIWQGELHHIALFSDGLQFLALKMPEGIPHPPFFSPLFRFISSITNSEEAQIQLESFLQSPKVTERTDDDLTLLLASCS